MREAARNERGEVDPARMGLLMLVHGLVEPKLTLEQAAELVHKAAGPVETILLRLLDLSGLNPLGQITAQAVAEAEKSPGAR